MASRNISITHHDALAGTVSDGGQRVYQRGEAYHRDWVASAAQYECRLEPGGTRSAGRRDDWTAPVIRWAEARGTAVL